jgi:hypothetical protein
MAVVLILGLMMTVFLPAIGAGGGSSLRRQGERVAGSLELARQLAVVTGKPHRVVIDVEGGSYFVEWLVTEAEEEGREEEPSDPITEGGQLDLTAPLAATADYYPIPNRFGRCRHTGGLDRVGRGRARLRVGRRERRGPGRDLRPRQPQHQPRYRPPARDGPDP